MSAASVAFGRKANRGPEPEFRVSGTMNPPGAAIARLCRQLWPAKTDAELALRAGISDRAARKILSGAAAPGFSTLVLLLQSEEGDLFLEALLGDATPAWRRRIALARRLGGLRAQIEAQRRELEILELDAADPPAGPAGHPARPGALRPGHQR